MGGKKRHFLDWDQSEGERLEYNETLVHHDDIMVWPITS